MANETLRQVRLREVSLALAMALALWDDELANHLLLEYAAVTSTRYLQRLRKYNVVRQRDLNLKMAQLHTYPDSDFRRLVRVDHATFQFIYDQIKDHRVFRSKGRKPQALPEWQLTIALFRLGYEGSGVNAFLVGDKFHISEGSIRRYTDRVIEALLDLEPNYVSWPNAEERRHIADWFGTERDINGGCVGVIDGCHIVFAYAPARSDKQDYYCYKGKYGFSICGICDHNKQLRYVLYGHTASNHDSYVYEQSRLFKQPELFLSDDEYILADSAYTVSHRVVPLFKCEKGNPDLEPDEQVFNTTCARARVVIEHTYGILKGRWQSLRGLRVRIGDPSDEARATCWIRACVVLHNMLVSTSDWVLQEIEEAQKAGTYTSECMDDIDIDPMADNDPLSPLSIGAESRRLRVMQDMGLDTSNQLRIIAARAAKRRKKGSQSQNPVI